MRAAARGQRGRSRGARAAAAAAAAARRRRKKRRRSGGGRGAQGGGDGGGRGEAAAGGAGAGAAAGGARALAGPCQRSRTGAGSIGRGPKEPLGFTPAVFPLLFAPRFYPPGFTAEDAAVIAPRWEKEESTWESRVPRVQRGFECAGISSVSDTFVSPPLGNGVFFGAQVSVARILVGSWSRETQRAHAGSGDLRSRGTVGPGAAGGRTAEGRTPLKRRSPERFCLAAGSEFRGERFRRCTGQLGKMAAPSARCLWRALAPRCGWVFPGLEQRVAVPAVVSPASARPYAAAAKTAKKDAKRSRQEKVKDKPAPRRRLLMAKPVDDVYLTWLYRRPSYELEQAVGMLKNFQELDFTYPKQFVYINVFLDMALQKKKKVDPFSSSVTLPHRFTDEVNKVLVFTENEQEAEIAREHGAAIVGGVELIKWILEDEIQADFYVAVPAIIPKLIPLRNKLKRKYPSTRRNSLGSDIPKMLQFFRECHEYAVEDEDIIKTRIARLDMPTEHIIANLKTIIHDICTFKPSNYDPIVRRLVIRSATSEGLLLNLDGILPQVEKVEEKEEKHEVDEDQQKPVQGSVST